MAQLLHSAGLAVKALTESSHLAHDAQLPLSAVIDRQKEQFTDAASRYFSLLSSINIRLRRQIHALEAAEILSAEIKVKEQQKGVGVTLNASASAGTASVPPTKQALINKTASMNGGVGNLDVGWLNSRNDNAGKEKEAELWAKAEELLTVWEEKMNKQSRNTGSFKS